MRIIEPVNGRILDVLTRNCRIADSVIARGLKISKDAVGYRIRAMETSGLIQNYITFIDARRLGFTRYHILIRFEGSIKNRPALYARLRQVPFLICMNTFIGRYDLQVIVDAADAFQLSDIIQSILKACQHRIRDYSVLTCSHDLEFTNKTPEIEYSIALEMPKDASFADLLAPRSFPAPASFARFHADRRHLLILKALADDPRVSLSTLSAQVGCDRQTARLKTEELIKAGVILSFGCVTNITLQKFVTYYLLVRLDHSTPAQKFKQPFLKLKNVFYAGRMLGDYDMIVYLNARSPEELSSSIEVFWKELGEYMLHYDLLVQDQVHYWRHLAPGLYEELLKRAG